MTTWEKEIRKSAQHSPAGWVTLTTAERLGFRGSASDAIEWVQSNGYTVTSCRATNRIMLSVEDIADCEKWASEGKRPENEWQQSGSSLVLDDCVVMPCPCGLFNNTTLKFDMKHGYYFKLDAEIVGPFSSHISAQLGAEMLIMLEWQTEQRENAQHNALMDWQNEKYIEGLS